MVMKKGFELEIEAKDGAITVNADQLNALKSAIADIEKKADEVDAVKAQAETAKAEIAALRQPFEADILNAQKALNMPEAEQLKDEAIKALPTSELISKSKELMSKLEGDTKQPETDNPYVWKSK
jgi:hypothetical protein